MKRLLFLLICFLPLQLLAGNPIDNDCSCKGIPLHGRVFITSDSGTEDFKITIVDRGYESVKVKIVDCCASECGQWEIVSQREYADFIVRIVSQGYEDFAITFDCVVPGLK